MKLLRTLEATASEHTSQFGLSIVFIEHAAILLEDLEARFELIFTILIDHERLELSKLKG